MPSGALPQHRQQGEAEWRRDNPWWAGFELSGPTRDGQLFSPTPGQRRYLNENRLEVRWVEDDGDCNFAAVARTVPQHELRDRIVAAAQRAGIPAPAGVPDLAGWLLREAASRAGVELPPPGPGDRVTGQDG